MQLEVTAELVHMLEQGRRFALATLVDAHGSTPQRIGARLLVRDDGTTVGTLGGGCIEAEIWEMAKDAIATGAPRTVDFTLNEDIAVDYGLACGGTERILIDPTFSGNDIALAHQMLSAALGDRRGVVISIVEPRGTQSVVNEVKREATYALFDDRRRTVHLEVSGDQVVIYLSGTAAPITGR